VTQAKRTGRILLVSCLAVAVVILAGTAGLAYWGQKKAADQVGGEIAFQFRDHPLVRRHIGADASFEVDAMEMDDAKGRATITLRAHGAMGDGVLWARIEKARRPDGVEGFNVVAAELRRKGEETLLLLPMD